MNYVSLKKKKRTGFTLVELLVVIAILAVLATVSVVGYLGFTKKAKISNDISLTTQMNTILQAEEAGGETFDTPHDAVEALQNGGLDISKLTPTTNGYSYVYDLKQNRMFLLDESKTKVAPSNQEATKDVSQLYAFIGKTSEQANWSGYSFYLKDNFSFDTTVKNGSESSQSYHKLFDYNGNLIQNTTNESKNIIVETGLDAGNNKNVNVTFEGSVKSNLIIRTTGDQSIVTVKVSSTAEKKDEDAGLSVHGFAKEVTVSSSETEKDTTVSISGSCNKLNVDSGKVDVEETAIVAKVEVGKNGNADVTNKGYIGAVVETNGDKETEVTSDKISGNKVGGNYEISTLSQLETFRNTVNAGNTFSDFNGSKIVELKSDITLKNGWIPIGEGNRKVAKENLGEKGNYFEGTFNGNNHTISNLNNQNYNPSNSSGTDRVQKDGDDSVYCYGLFALVRNATIKNLKLTNVDIDQERYSGAKIDSVAGLAGYASGKCTFSGITISGSINARDAAAGIVGRWYFVEAGSLIENCSSNTTIRAIGNKDSKGAGILGFASSFNTNGKITIKNCSNNGSVTGYCNADNIGVVANKDQKNAITVENCGNNSGSAKYTESAKKCIGLLASD